jgi:hypothetical protein
VLGLAWSPDGEWLAATGHRQVNLWRPTAAPGPVRSFRGHTDLVRGVAWSPDGRLVASVGDDGFARVWSSETLHESLRLETGPGRAIGWSPDGLRLATGGTSGRLALWDARSGALLHEARRQTTISSLSWAPNGNSFAVGGINGMATLWSAGGDDLLAKLRTSDAVRNDVNGLTWSPGARLLTSAHGAKGTGGVWLWDVAGTRAVASLTDTGGWVRGISWTLDGRWLAAGGQDGKLRVWELDAGDLVATLPTDSGSLWTVGWSPDGRMLAAGGTGSAGPPAVGGVVFVWSQPVDVSPSPGDTARAREIEARLLSRGALAPPPAPTPSRRAPWFEDGGAYGLVIRLEPPFGNLETSFSAPHLRSLGIARDETFLLRCRETTVAPLLASHWEDVPRGEWVAYWSLEETLVIARNGASASEATGCRPGDRVFIARSVR